MLYQHARGRHVEDFARPIMLTDIDLPLFKPLVWIAEAVGGHPHFLESRRVFPRNDLRADYRGRLVGADPVHHAVNRIAIKYGVVVDEQKQVRVGLDASKSPIDRAPEAERARSSQVPPSPSSEMSLCGPLEVRGATMVLRRVVDNEHVEGGVGLVGQPNQALAQPVTTVVRSDYCEHTGRARCCLPSIGARQLS